MRSKTKLLKYSAWSIAVLLVAGVLLRLALAPASSAALSYWFAEQGLESELEDLSFDLGNANLTLSGLKASDSGATVLRLDRARVDWSWSALRERELRIVAIALDGLEFDIEQDTSNRLVIAGIDLHQLASASEDEVAEAGEPPEWSLALGNVAVDNLRMCLRVPRLEQHCNRWDAFAWDGEILLDLAKIDASELPLLVRGDLRLAGLAVENMRLERELLSFDELSLVGISAQGSNAIGIESIAMDALAFLERAVETGATQVTLVERLEIDGLALGGMSHLDIAEVRLRNHEAIVVNDVDRKLEINEWLESIAREQAEQAELAEPEAQGDAAGTEAEAAFTFAIGRLNYQTDKSLRYLDQSYAQPFSVNVNSIEFDLRDIDSRKPEQPSQMRYSAQYDRHGKIELEGTTRPLAEKISFDIEGQIRGLDLRELSAVTSATIGHSIRSGQLDADLTLRATDNILDSEIDLTLYQLNFRAESPEDQEKVDNSLGLPLNTSLALLRDDKNRIELSIPVTGDLASPDISPRDAVMQAVSKAITTTVLTFYTPFGLIPLAGGVIDLATALKFEPVVFEAASGDIDDADVDGLDKLAALMQEKPGIYLTLCPITNSADRRKLFPKTAGIEANKFEPDAKQARELKELGEARGIAVKQYLRDGEIESARLVLCAPEHVENIEEVEGVQSSGKIGISGVEISI